MFVLFVFAMKRQRIACFVNVHFVTCDKARLKQGVVDEL